MSDKADYLMSIVSSDLQKFIMSNIEKEPEELLGMCIEYLKGCKIDVKD